MDTKEFVGLAVEMQQSMEIPEEVKQVLRQPLPPEAVKAHPVKKFLSTINPIHVVERLNQAFGIGGWYTNKRPVLQDRDAKMVVLDVEFFVPKYGIYLNNFGGNDNADIGDAYKGAYTDALTKIASYLGIGAEVWKDDRQGGQRPPYKPAQKQAPAKSNKPAAPPAGKSAQPGSNGNTKPAGKPFITDQNFAALVARFDKGEFDIFTKAEQYYQFRGDQIRKIEVMQLDLEREKKTAGEVSK
jgi:hypothetical protein